MKGYIVKTQHFHQNILINNSRIMPNLDSKEHSKWPIWIWVGSGEGQPDDGHGNEDGWSRNSRGNKKGRIKGRMRRTGKDGFSREWLLDYDGVAVSDKEERKERGMERQLCRELQKRLKITEWEGTVPFSSPVLVKVLISLPLPPTIGATVPPLC